MFDVHSDLQHQLSDVAEEHIQALDKAHRAGVTGFVVTASAENRRQAVLSLAKEQGVGAATGLGPRAVSSMTEKELDDRLERLRRDLEGDNWCAVGAIGLDYESGVDLAVRKRQRRALVAQLGLARELALPVILTVQGAHNSMIKILRREGLAAAGGMICDYSGSPRQVGPFLMLNLDLSVGPAIVGDRAEEVRQVVAQMPEDRLLVESNAGGRDEGVDKLDAIVAAVADIWGRRPKQVARYTAENGRRRFGVQFLA